MEKEQFIAIVEAAWVKHFSIGQWPVEVHNALENVRAEIKSEIEKMSEAELSRRASAASPESAAIAKGGARVISMKAEEGK